MKITVKYFASLREALGPSEVVELTPGSSVGELREQLIRRGEPHASALAHGRALRAALNQTLCDESARIHDAVEVAFFPPVTGG